MRMTAQGIHNIAVWCAIIGLLLLGIKADTRSVTRDIEAMKFIGTMQKAIITNQEAVVELIKEDLLKTN